MKVKFLQTRTVKAAGGETFEANKVYDLEPVSAERWIRRGVAVAASEDDLEAAEKAAAKGKKAPTSATHKA